MKTSRKKPLFSSPIILVVLLISLLTHVFVVMIVGEVWDFSFKPKDNKQEIVMVSAETPVEPAPEVSEDPPVPEKKEKSTQKIADLPQEPQPEPVEQTPPEPQIPPMMEPSPFAPQPVEPQPEVVPPQHETSPLSQEELARVNLDVNWKSFSRTFAEEATKARETHVEASLVKRRQAGTFSGMSAKVKRALETNIGWAKPGNQEPLGNRRKVFYRYIKMIHEERIHPIFGHGFWESLAKLGSAHELNDMSLTTLAEFEILENGAVNEVRVVRTSGNMVFDAAAIDSVYRGSPFPPPPKEILSWNGRVYLKWGFYRSRRMCGVFNVEPYILKAHGEVKEEVQIDDFISGAEPSS